MRREEIATARWDAISDDGQWRTVIGKHEDAPPTAARRDPRGARAIPTDGEWVFPGRFGDSVSVATIWGWIRDVADEAGVGPVRPHELRHTCLAMQNDRTGDLRAVQAFAGHSKPETTSGYTRAKNEALRKVVEALDY